MSPFAKCDAKANKQLDSLRRASMAGQIQPYLYVETGPKKKKINDVYVEASWILGGWPFIFYSTRPAVHPFLVFTLYYLLNALQISH